MDDYQGLSDGVATLTPGPDLAAALAGTDPTRLAPHDRVVLAQAHSRLAAHYQGALLADLVAVADVVTDPADPDGSAARYQWSSPATEPHALAVAEIAAGLSWTHSAAWGQLHLAEQAVRRLPQVHAAMLAGRIDLPKARVLCETVADLDDAQAGVVLDRVLPDAGSRTTAQLRVRLRRLVIKADPALAERRYRDGMAGRRLRYGPDHDGTWFLGGYGLPADAAADAVTRIESEADRRRADGDTRPVDQLRSDVFLDLLNQRLAPNPTTSGTATDGTATPDHPGDNTVPTGEPAETVRRYPRARRGGLEVVIDLETLLDLADHPADLGSWEPVVAEVARSYVRRLTTDALWVTLTDHTGRAVDTVGVRRRPTTTADADKVRSRDRTCRFPHVRQPAHRSDLDHPQEWQHGGLSTLDNLGLLCPTHHRLKSAGRWKVTQIREGVFLWESWLGHTYLVEPDIIHEPDLYPD